ncbi:MAG: Outer rane receptor protein mostly Fe transport [Sphingomonadales bacterium]|nr:Outer rane receptor protein mostly Fe transport [Sphingomonadales bacterium]
MASGFNNKRRIGSVAILGVSASIYALACSTAVLAQTAPVVPQPADAAAQDQVDNSTVSEIVVTANKRVQKLSDVGLAVAVVGGDALRNQKISSLADIAQTVPGLSYTPSANSTPVYTLRGVGFYETSLGAYPTVPIYIDESPLSFPATAAHSAFDLERVEVLKGPQGTLFGQNATGGAINYIAAKPTQDFKAGLDLSYGRFNEVDAEGFVSGPLSSTLRARVSGRYERADGWQTSNTRPGDTNGKKSLISGRLLLDFQPVEAVRFQLNVNGWHEGGETQSPQYVATNPQQVALSPKVASAQYSPQTPRAADWTPGLPYRNNDMFQAALRTDIDVTDTITLTSLSSYVHYKQNQREEGDGLPAVSLDLVVDRGTINSFAQELRLANGDHSNFRWVTGANFERSKVNQENQASCPDSSTAPLFFPVCEPNYFAKQKMTNYAFFGNVEYDLLPKITFKAGVRYTQSKRDADLCTRDINSTPDVGNFFYDVLLGGALGPYPRGSCYVINDQPTTINGVAPFTPGEYAATLKEHNVSWRAGLDWKPQPGLLLYGNIAKGYKAGSFPAVSATVFTAFLPVKQESVISYEAGLKAALFHRAVNFSAAAYYYDYSDKQIRSKRLAAPFGILDVLQNIPKSDVKGFELELSGSPVSGLTTSAAFNYTDAKIKTFTGINAAGVVASFDGTRVPFTPKYQASFTADYKTALTSSIDGFVGGTASYRSSTVAIIGGDFPTPTITASAVGNPFIINGYTLVDLRAGVAAPDNRWRVSVYGKNVFNKYYWSNVVAAFDTIGRYAGMPGTYGISFSYRY